MIRTYQERRNIMIMKSNLMHRAMSILIVSLFSLMLMSANDDVFAFQPSPPHGRGAKIPAHGTMVTHLPRGHKTVHVGKMKYFHHNGVFYKRGPSGYVVIAAPIGAVVVGLPAGYLTIAVNGSTYYAYAGIYYRKVPSGYVVVEPPQEAIVVRQTSPAVQSPPVVGGDVSVTAQKLNVRSGPGLSHSVIRQLHQGDVLVIHGYAPDWFYVKLPDGKFGWVMKIYTTQLQPASG
jgi:hypothetical protein